MRLERWVEELAQGVRAESKVLATAALPRTFDELYTILREEGIPEVNTLEVVWRLVENEALGLRPNGKFQAIGNYPHQLWLMNG
ncbi:MAG: hypothetical protein AAB694_00230 [Patescibacteria group bacterium]